ncbi:MAG: hypothetical protein P9L94_18840 [Candidatus Hinthialibacter antarcticus]|nr:hypothetical protein [Candidatus Hinthialibacter antarcticus]
MSIYIFVGVAAVSAQELDQWLLLRWPLREATSIGEEIATADFENAWHENRIYRHVQKPLHIIEPSSDSLAEYLDQLRDFQPQCVEADWEFAQAHLNSADVMYVPVLRFRRPFQIQAELIRELSGSPATNLLGVVSPDFSIGGGIQIARMQEQGGPDIQWHSFASPRETLRQLFVGAIHAAAVPEGYYDLLLREMGRTDLTDRFERERFPAETLRVYWLREDVYRDLFLRTIITETWLRDRFASRLERFANDSVRASD